ncbi:MAG: aminoglycoside phosphotransferase family protein [Clostridia bacterium]|nr:aminoglycoside phosphotransferase family protein [Clostridia bacterium]
MGIQAEEIAAVLRQFGVDYDAFQIETFHSGHINSTHRVVTRYKGVSDAFVAQRINTYVFPDPVGIMENIDLVTGHIRQKLVEAGIDPARRVLNFLKRSDGTNYFFESRESFWRVYHFVPNTVTYDKAEDPSILTSAGAAFGTFQRQLADLDMALLKETMPGFHDTPRRFQNLMKAVRADSEGRLAEVEKDVAAIEEYQDLWSRLVRLHDEGTLPYRVTHNDTKYNNVLVDATTGEAVCVIDLDTVSPGLAAWDFGDAVRFSGNRAAEDEPDLSRVRLDVELYEAFASGFIPACREGLTEKELETLHLGCVTMAFELSMRFLEDYLRGDKYFRIQRPRHNLYRARNQLALALDMVAHLDDCLSINRKYF